MSFSRLRRGSSLPIRSGADSPSSHLEPFRRTPSLLSVDPSTPEIYSVTKEERAGLHDTNRQSREGGGKLTKAGIYRARQVNIPPPREKSKQPHFSSSPLTASGRPSPLPTIHSQAILPTYDLNDLQQASPQSSANSLTAQASPLLPPPALSLPPRSDSRAPSIEQLQIAASHRVDSGFQYEYENDLDKFNKFFGIGDSPDSDAGTTGAYHHYDAGDGSSIDKELVRNDSPMELLMGVVANDDTPRTHHIDEEDLDKTSEKMVADQVKPRVLVSEREQDLADRIQTLPNITSKLYQAFPPSSIPMQVHHTHGFNGLAGVKTAGKMRAARAAAQQDERGFARGTASSAAKSSAPPDIPRVVSTVRPTKM